MKKIVLNALIMFGKSPPTAVPPVTASAIVSALVAGTSSKNSSRAGSTKSLTTSHQPVVLKRISSFRMDAKFS